MTEPAPITPPAPPATPEPKPISKPGEPAPFDPSKLADEDITKTLEDARIWKTPRMKELLEADKTLKKIKADQEEAEKKRLAEQGQFKELADKANAERDAAIKKASELELDMLIHNAASKKGITDLEAASKLIDRANIKKGDDGAYAGITEAIEALATARPYLINATPSTVGGPTNPANPNTPPGSFTLTQIQDPAFYQKNRDAIVKAQSEGKIINDRQ